MENALFSKEIANGMLKRQRVLILIYMMIWIALFSIRRSDVDLLMWVTQVVFSADILADWLRLEWLRVRHEDTYSQLHQHFLNDIGQNSPAALAGILDAFVGYESAKSAAGVILSSTDFQVMNPELSKRWDSVRRDLKMDEA
jgi:hypothetical protein